MIMLVLLPLRLLGYFLGYSCSHGMTFDVGNVQELGLTPIHHSRIAVDILPARHTIQEWQVEGIPIFDESLILYDCDDNLIEWVVEFTSFILPQVGVPSPIFQLHLTDVVADLVWVMMTSFIPSTSSPKLIDRTSTTDASWWAGWTTTPRIWVGAPLCPWWRPTPPSWSRPWCSPTAQCRVEHCRPQRPCSTSLSDFRSERCIYYCICVTTSRCTCSAAIGLSWVSSTEGTMHGDWLAARVSLGSAPGRLVCGRAWSSHPGPPLWPAEPTPSWNRSRRWLNSDNMTIK